jgi:hypothetical protein
MITHTISYSWTAVAEKIRITTTGTTIAFGDSVPGLFTSVTWTAIRSTASPLLSRRQALAQVLGGALRPPGQARLTVAVQRGEHEAAENGQVLGEVQPLLSPLVICPGLPEPMTTEGGEQQRPGKSSRRQSWQPPQDQQRSRGDIDSGVDSYQHDVITREAAHRSPSLRHDWSSARGPS